MRLAQCLPHPEIVRPGACSERAAVSSRVTRSPRRRQAARELSAELRRRESELLARQLSQQRALLSRLEAPALKPHERATLLQTLKRLQQGTQRTRQTLAETLRRSAGKVPRTHRAAGRAAGSAHLVGVVCCGIALF